MMRDWMGSGAMRITTIIIVCAFLICLGACAVFLFSPSDKIIYSSMITEAVSTSTAPVPLETIAHLPTPEPLKAVYMTACTASRKDLRDKALGMFQGTELNSIVIDVKDYSGTISYASTSLQSHSPGGCRIGDLPAFLAELHAHGIYAIGRVTVFQDPSYASLHPDLAVRSKSRPDGIWKDKHGLAFIDVGARPYWDYIVSIAKEAHNIGFDEINFDYIRFPSDGNMSDAVYSWDASTTKAVAVKNFFSYLHAKLEPEGIVSSADLFGLVTSATGDLGIGQVLENALPYFDYVAPMVYPSHFASGFDGFAKPAEHPHDIIDYSMANAVRKAVAASSTPGKLRPWLQDFNLGAKYTPDMVRAQIQGTYDAGLTSWMLWNAASSYQKTALLPSENVSGNLGKLATSTSVR